MKGLIVITVFILLSPTALCQQVVGQKRSISIGFGVSSVFLKDSYISPSEYSGNALLYKVNWGTVNSDRSVQINLLFKEANNLSHKVSEATNKSFQLNYRQYYFISEQHILGKQADFSTGPGITFFFAHRSQKTVPIESTIGFGSVDLTAKADIKLTSQFSISSDLLLSTLAFSSKSKDERSEDNNFAILTPFYLQNLSIGAHCRYQLNQLIYAGASYRFNLLKNTKWQYYRMIEDVVALHLEIRF